MKKLMINIKKIIKKVLKAVILLVLIYFFILLINKLVGVTEYKIVSEKIPENFNGYTIVQISDLHNEEFGKDNVRLIEKIKATNPDIIVITGDLIDSYNTDIPKAEVFVTEVVKIAPTYYTTGNHEYRLYDDYLVFEETMKSLGVHVLHNEGDVVEIDGEVIQLLGLDANMNQNGRYYVPNNENVQVYEILNQLNDENIYSVLLSHRPELFDIYVNENIDLTLTGHTHGGQVRIPFLGGVIAPNQNGLFPKYDSGLFEEDGSTMIISRGLGNSSFPIRIFNQPEIVVVKMYNK